jgi:glycosyltransferase involved in cell wall biosynthesis
MKICVSIASYRDPDLINTVNSAYNNAKNKKDISFCVVSQAADDEHPDLSHIPNVIYVKYHWSESNGLCWARNIGTNNSNGEFTVQVDSHSRFNQNWDEILSDFYHKAVSYWGDRIIISKNSDPFEIKEDGTEEFSEYPIVVKTKPLWNTEYNRFTFGNSWHNVENYTYGDEVFYISGGGTFARTDILKSVAPDPVIYFEDQMSVAIRAYTRGIRLIFCPENFVFSLHDRSGDFDRLASFTGPPPKVNRRLHWEDNPKWGDSSVKMWASNRRLDQLYSGKLGGFWGIGSRELYEQFAKINEINFIERD